MEFNMEKVLINALDSLTARVNLSTGLIHPMDKDSAKEMFKILHANHVFLDCEEIEQWAVMNGWFPNYAKELGILGEKIGTGRQVQIKNKNLWAVDSFSQWKNK